MPRSPSAGGGISSTFRRPSSLSLSSTAASTPSTLIRRPIERSGQPAAARRPSAYRLTLCPSGPWLSRPGRLSSSHELRRGRRGHLTATALAAKTRSRDLPPLKLHPRPPSTCDAVPLRPLDPRAELPPEPTRARGQTPVVGAVAPEEAVPTGGLSPPPACNALVARRPAPSPVHTLQACKFLCGRRSCSCVFLRISFPPTVPLFALLFLFARGFSSPPPLVLVPALMDQITTSRLQRRGGTCWRISRSPGSAQAPPVVFVEGRRCSVLWRCDPKPDRRLRSSRILYLMPISNRKNR